MRCALLVVAMMLVAGCAGPASEPADPPDQGGLAFGARRVDTDGDGRTDAINLTLVGTSEPIPRDQVEMRRDGEPVVLHGQANASTWRPGTSLLVDCPEGVHEFELSVRGELVRVLVEECGKVPPKAPPFFQGSLVDGDGDGRTDAVELTVTSGGPVETSTLTVHVGGTPVRLYENARKTRLAPDVLENGTRAFTPCRPNASTVNISWASRALPPLRLSGCQAFDPGIDAPVTPHALDVDGDGRQDGWRLTMGATEDGPFPIEALDARWGNATARLNASTALAPPPATLDANRSLVATCPAEGERTFELRVNGSLVVRRFTMCEAAPGQPLFALDLVAEAGGLNATLNLSRVGAVELANLTTPDGQPVGEGLWSEGSTVALPCPGDRLTLLYQGRLAFRGPAPC